MFWGHFLEGMGLKEGEFPTVNTFVNLQKPAQPAAPSMIEINRTQYFSLEEARELLPIVFRITKNYSSKVQALIERLEGLGSNNEAKVASLEKEVSQSIAEWQSKVQKLGAIPKGLWIADFDSGDGYFCWKFPERSLDFWHGYNDGYTKRVSVAERNRPVSLQERLRKKILDFSPAPSNDKHPSVTSPLLNFQPLND
jgi:hypothetical protein